MRKNEDSHTASRRPSATVGVSETTTTTGGRSSRILRRNQGSEHTYYVQRTFRDDVEDTWDFS